MTNYPRDVSFRTAEALGHLERHFINDAEAHALLAIIYSAICCDQPEVWTQDFYRRVHRCVAEHIRLSGDVYDRR